MKALVLVLLFFISADLYGASSSSLENRWLGCMFGLARLRFCVSLSPLHFIEKTEKLIIENPEVVNYQTQGNHGTLLHQVIKCIYEHLDDQIILSRLNRLVTLLLEKKPDLTAEMLIKKSSSRTPLELAIAYSLSKNKESFGYYILTSVAERIKKAMEERAIPIREESPWSEEALFDLLRINERG